MHRIVIRLLISVLTFSVGVAAFALVGGLFNSVRREASIPPVSTETDMSGVEWVCKAGRPRGYIGEAPQRPSQRVDQPAAPNGPINGGGLNGRAILLEPSYPAIARSAHACGTVTVQVVIDENGSVISAHATSGHPLLYAAAVTAARAARFSPTRLSGQPVKVNGVITYNFLPIE
jgi:TonB family protein